MYGTEWCHFCKNQKAIFGNSFKKINYVDCDRNSAECTANGVTGYPTWKINEQNYPGVQQPTTLATLSGCVL